MLFTLLAPLANVAEWLGWDPRLSWGLMLGVRAVCERVYGRQRRILISGNALLAWFLFCLVADRVLNASTAVLTSEDATIALSLFFYFVAGSMFLFAVLQFVVSKHQVKAVLCCFAAAALAVSLYAAWQAFTTYGAGSAERIGATLGNPNYLATNLALASTSLLLVALRHRGPFGVFFLVGAAVALLGTALTLSRAGIMSAVVGWVLAYVTRTGRLEYRKAFLMFAVAALIAGLGASAFLFNYRQEVTFSADPNRTDMATASQAAEDFTRLEAALYAIQLIGEHPILGSGFGTFAARNYNANGFYVATHDTWLQLLADTGAVGTILLGTLLWSLARGLRKPGRILYLPVAGCFLVSSLFGDYLQSIDVLVILSVMYVFSRHATGSDWLASAKVVEA
jgi:O-antigen ligase